MILLNHPIAEALDLIGLGINMSIGKGNQVASRLSEINFRSRSHSLPAIGITPIEMKSIELVEEPLEAWKRITIAGMEHDGKSGVPHVHLEKLGQSTEVVSV